MINAEINELQKKHQSVSIFFLQKKLTSVPKTHFINKQTPEFQEYIASFSSVQCSSWPFNNQFGCFLLLECWCGHIFYDALQKSND
jgi:hypothetical protein